MPGGPVVCLGNVKKFMLARVANTISFEKQNMSGGPSFSFRVIKEHTKYKQKPIEILNSIIIRLECKKFQAGQLFPLKI